MNYLTVKELSEKFRVSPRTVHNWIRAGHIAAVKIGGKTLIPDNQNFGIVIDSRQ